MRRNAKSPLISLTFLGFLTLLLPILGCDPETNYTPSSTCDPHSADIGVTDGKLAALCGCDEAGGTWVSSSTGAFTCTVRAGTVLNFSYLGTVGWHQIISTTTSPNSFPPSPVSIPGQLLPIRVHSVTLSAGTYLFSDTYDNSVSGKIIAN